MWVTDWLSKRAEKEEKKVTREEKPVDAAAQAKRQQARQQMAERNISETLQSVNLKLAQPSKN